MRRRYQVVLGQLIDALAEGQFAEGDWLPSERELGERLGSGRGAVREAVRALQLRGLIDVVSGRGQCVLPTDRWDVHEADVLIALAEHGRMPGLLREAVDARTTAERDAARLATANATAGDLRLLHGRLVEMERAAELEQRGDERD